MMYVCVAGAMTQCLLRGGTKSDVCVWLGSRLSVCLEEAENVMHVRGWLHD